jgi:hypothetical protein
VSPLDMLLQLGLVPKLPAAVLDRTDELFLRHVVQEHVDQRTGLLNGGDFNVLVGLLLVYHDAVAVRAEVHETGFNIGQVLGVNILVSRFQ